MPKERNTRIGGLGGEQYSHTIQNMPEDEYQKFDKLTPEQKLRYLNFRQAHNTSTVDKNIERAKDEGAAKARAAVSLAKGAIDAYERAVRNLKNGYGDEISVTFAKKELRKSRSELIAAEKNLGSGGQAMQVRLTLMQVRQLLKGA